MVRKSLVVPEKKAALCFSVTKEILFGIAENHNTFVESIVSAIVSAIVPIQDQTTMSCQFLQFRNILWNAGQKVTPSNMGLVPPFSCASISLLVIQSSSFEIYVPFSQMDLPKKWFVYVNNSIERSIKMRAKSPNFLSSLQRAILSARRDTILQHKVLFYSFTLCNTQEYETISHKEFWVKFTFAFCRANLGNYYGRCYKPGYRLVCRLAMFLAVGGFGEDVARIFHNNLIYYELHYGFYMNLTVQSEYSDAKKGQLANGRLKIFMTYSAGIWLSLAKGQWPLIQVIPPGSLVESIEIYNMKLKYQIIDAQYVHTSVPVHKWASLGVETRGIESPTEFTKKIFHIVSFSRYFTFQKNFFVRYFGITTKLWNTLVFALKQHEQIRVVKMYDGPYTLCEEINISNKKVVTSTFQALLVIMGPPYSNEDDDMMAMAAKFTAVDQTAIVRHINSTDQDVNNIFTCFGSNQSKGHQCNLLLCVEKPFFVNASVNISFVGIQVDDCTLGGLTVHIGVGERVRNVLRYCADTHSPLLFVSPQNTLHFTRYSYDVFGQMNITYRCRLSRCKGVFINPVLARHNKDHPNCNAAAMIEESPYYSFEFSNCESRFAHHIHYQVHNGYCINIQVSPTYFTFIRKYDFTFTFCLLLHSEVSDLEMLHVYSMNSTYYLENNDDGVSVHLGAEFGGKFATTRAKPQGKFHWKHKFLHFVELSTTAKECFSLTDHSYADIERFTRSNFSVVISHQQHALTQPEGVLELQKLRTMSLSFNNPEKQSVPMKLLQYQSLSVSASQHPRHADEDGYIVLDISSDSFAGECASCSRTAIAFESSQKIHSKVLLMLNLSLRYFAKRTKFQMSIPGTITAKNILVEVSNKRNLRMLFHKKASNITQITKLREAVRYPDLLHGFVQEDENKEYVTYTSSGTFLSWHDAHLICTKLDCTLPEFYTSVELDKFLMRLKGTYNILPIRAVFIGLKQKVTFLLWFLHSLA